MLAYSTSLLPLNPRTTATITVSPYMRGPGFGVTPFKPGFRNGIDSRFDSYGGDAILVPREHLQAPYGIVQTKNLPGLRGACGCSATTGCGCAGSGFAGFRQDGGSIDQIAVDWFNRIFGAVTGHPPAGSTTPVPGSPGYYSGSIPPWVPLLIIGYVALKAIK